MPAPFVRAVENDAEHDHRGRGEEVVDLVPLDALEPLEVRLHEVDATNDRGQDDDGGEKRCDRCNRRSHSGSRHDPPAL
jgi:hypothetical protein